MTREEMILIAKKAKNPEELLALANENDVEMTEESAKAYFEQLHKSGEISDDELDNVAGGWCYHDGYPVITVGEQWDCFVCSSCGSSQRTFFGDHTDCSDGLLANCDSCKYCKWSAGLWLCHNPANRKN